VNAITKGEKYAKPQTIRKEQTGLEQGKTPDCVAVKDRENNRLRGDRCRVTKADEILNAFEPQR
jgi:hypothetical protein